MLAAIALSYTGFTALCLSMERHYSDLLGHKPSPRARLGLRVTGWLLLLATLCATISNAGWAMGLVHGSTVLMATVVLLVWLLPYQPRLALALAGAGVIVGPLALLLPF